MVGGNERLISPGDVVIKELTITSITGEKFDITNHLSELNIYEDIFSNGLSGNIVLTDWANLFNLIPIFGQEKLTVSFKTPVIDTDNKTLEFQIYKISDRILEKERTQIYTLYFASIPTVKNSLTKISKSYQGQISDIVNDIVLDYLDSELFSSFGTVGNHKFIIPYWNPFKTINFLAKKAVSQASKDTSFVFYEDLDGFNFYPISQMLSEPSREIQDSYVFAPFQKFGDVSKESIKKIKENFFAIKEYKILDAMDNLNAIRSGVYASNLITYDMTTKQIGISQYNYIDDFDDFTYIKDKGKSNPLTVDKENPSGFKYHDFSDSYRVTYEKNTKMYDGVVLQNPEDYILQRQSLLNQLKMHRMRILVAGNSTLRVGHVLNLTLPSPENMVNEFKYDKMATGKYLITNIRHKIKKGNYENVIELSKNSFYEPLPEK